MTSRIEIGAGLEWEVSHVETGKECYRIGTDMGDGVCADRAELSYNQHEKCYIANRTSYCTSNELRAIADFMDTLKTKEGG